MLAFPPFSTSLAAAIISPATGASIVKGLTIQLPSGLRTLIVTSYQYPQVFRPVVGEPVISVLPELIAELRGVIFIKMFNQSIVSIFKQPVTPEIEELDRCSRVNAGSRVRPLL